MAIDPVTRKAFRTPMFLGGVLMLAAGLVPAIVAETSGWNAASGLAGLSALAPLGAGLMAAARHRASEEWKKCAMARPSGAVLRPGASSDR
ncbi:MAG: hypothetical protein ABI592_13395 [Acidobacteriota bacterium]